MTDQLILEKPKETLQLSNLPDRLLTASEITGILHCSAVQVYRMAKRGEISSMPFGKSVRFLLNHVTEFVASHIHDARGEFYGNR
jgi:predicted DNA-binding transcriptional regulator AlpA